MTARLAPALILALLLLGCAGARLDVPVFQAEVARGRYEAALSQLEKAGDEDDVASMLDRGLLLGALGRYRESNAVFDRAETRIEDLYTRSLSKEALSLVTSDRALDYRPPGFEYAYIAYYRAWNYLRMGWPEDVLVEARRIGERLTWLSGECSSEDGACGHDLFLRYFSGLLFEWGGETNDAYVAYKQADLARATMASRFGVQPPPDLGLRLVRLARRLGFPEEASAYAEAYGLDPDAPIDPRTGSVVVIVEEGMVGRRAEQDLTIPIFKGETSEIRRDPDGWPRRLSGRAHAHYEDVKLDYLLRVALPRFDERPPPGGPATFTLGSATSSTRVAAAISAQAAAALDEAMGGILLRAVGRALTKYLAKEAADKNIGEGAGFVVNLLGAALEGADTRSWRSLPYEIQTTAFEVQPGTYEGRLTLPGPGGRVLATREFPDIRVPAGGVAFVRYRSGF